MGNDQTRRSQGETALDRVEAGPLPEGVSPKPGSLPGGVNSRMLYRDVVRIGLPALAEQAVMRAGMIAPQHRFHHFSKP